MAPPIVKVAVASGLIQLNCGTNSVQGGGPVPLAPTDVTASNYKLISHYNSVSQFIAVLKVGNKMVNNYIAQYKPN